MTKCSILDCPNPAKKRGWCNTHYDRWRRHGDPLIARHYYKGTPEERFWAKVDKSGGENACWPWLGAVQDKGYGIAEGENDIFAEAHILGYRWSVGEISKGMVIDHTCHNPLVCRLGSNCPHRRCQNPAHLEAVTQGENVRRGALVVGR